MTTPRLPTLGRRIVAARTLHATVPAEPTTENGRLHWPGDYIEGTRLAHEGQPLRVLTVHPSGALRVVKLRRRIGGHWGPPFLIGPDDWRLLGESVAR